MVNKRVVTSCSTGYKTGQRKRRLISGSLRIKTKMDLFWES